MITGCLEMLAGSRLAGSLQIMSGAKVAYREWGLAMMDRIVGTRLRKETRED